MGGGGGIGFRVDGCGLWIFAVCACLMFGSWILNKIWIIDLSSAFIGTLKSSSKLFLFFEISSFKLSCEIVIGIVLCCCHQASCLHYYLGKINIGIHMYQFTFEPLHLCFRMWLWFEQKFWRKQGTDRRICIPLFTPLIERMHSCPAAMQIYWNKRKCYIREEFISHWLGLVQQHGKCFIVLKHQYGCP